MHEHRECGKLKIAWVSPVPPAHTAIAKWSILTIKELRKYTEIDVFTFQKAVDEKVQDEFTCFQLDDINCLENYYNQYDVFIYNIGNNKEFHKEILLSSILYPGISIMHDGIIQDLMLSFGESKKECNFLYNVCEMIYGCHSFLEVINSIMEQKIKLNKSREFTFIELIQQTSLKVIVHSPAIIENKQASENIALLNLSIPVETEKSIDRDYSPPYNILIFGYLSYNRRMEQFLEYFSEFDRKSMFQITIMGKYDNHIINLIKKLKIESYVYLIGYTSEKDFEETLSNAHFAINLRYPTMNEASMSQLEIFSHSLPSMVTDKGFYSYLPDKTVKKISVENEREDVLNTLRDFCENPYKYKIMGKEGFDYLITNHSVKKYAQKLYEEIHETLNNKSNKKVATRIDRDSSIFYNDTFSVETITKEYINILKCKMGNRPLFIWGTGKGGQKAVEILTSNNIEVKGFIDNNLDALGTKVCDLDVYSFELYITKLIEKPYILISTMYFMEVEKQILNRGYNNKDYSIHLTIFPFFCLLS